MHGCHHEVGHVLRKGVTFEQRPEYRMRGSHATLWKESISSEETVKTKFWPRKGTWHISRTRRLEGLHIAGEESKMGTRL